MPGIACRAIVISSLCDYAPLRGLFIGLVPMMAPVAKQPMPDVPPIISPHHHPHAEADNEEAADAQDVLMIAALFDAFHQVMRSRHPHRNDQHGEAGEHRVERQGPARLVPGSRARRRADRRKGCSGRARSCSSPHHEHRAPGTRAHERALFVRLAMLAADMPMAWWTERGRMTMAKPAAMSSAPMTMSTLWCH